jgi:hypothetical protein
MIWFTRINSVVDHALTALAALPRVKSSRFFRGLSWCIAGARSLLNGQAQLAQRAGLTGKPDWAFLI